MNTKLKQLTNVASRLGYSVVFSKNLSWNHSKSYFYPRKKIIVGLKNYNSDTVNCCELGYISERAQALILAHELGHIKVKKKLYPKTNITEYCLNDNPEFEIKNEVYAWQIVLNSEKLTLEELEFIQLTINEYYFCEYVGLCIVDDYLKAAQNVIDQIKD